MARKDSDNFEMDDQDRHIRGIVGAWTEEKHNLLAYYLEASSGARQKFSNGSGGAGYAELFAGTGKARIRNTSKIIQGSPLVAAEAVGKAPFTSMHFADASTENIDALKFRMEKANHKATYHVGIAEETVVPVTEMLPKNGLNVVFLDPFNLESLPFTIIEKLSMVSRIDLLIHVSTMDWQRNMSRYLDTQNNGLDAFAPGWRACVDSKSKNLDQRRQIFKHWRSLFTKLGLKVTDDIAKITGSKNQNLYWMIQASRHSLAEKLWQAAVKAHNPQGDLF